MNDTTETARALLYRHGLPEDVIDGALALHAQELAAVQRTALARTDDPVFYEGEAGWLVDLIDPTLAETAPAAAAGLVPAADRAAFVPPAAEHLPPGVLDSATEGANRLDAWAKDPRGRNFLAHALVQLARDGWLRTEPGEGFEPVRDRETPEPDATPVAASHSFANEHGAPVAAPDRAAVLREAADVLAAHPGAIPYRPQLDEDGGFWWDTRDRDAAADLLRRMADETPQPTDACPDCGHRTCNGNGPCGAILSVGALSENRCQCPGAPAVVAQPDGEA